MITFRTSMDVTADRRVILTLPPDTPVGKAELTVTIASPDEGVSLGGVARGHFGAVRGGNPRSADNDGIDADLARDYGHDPE